MDNIPLTSRGLAFIIRRIRYDIDNIMRNIGVEASRAEHVVSRSVPLDAMLIISPRMIASQGTVDYRYFLSRFRESDSRPLLKKSLS